MRLRDRVEHALRERDRLRRCRQQLIAELPGHVGQLVRRRDPVREADRVRLASVDEAAGHDQLLRAPESDDGRQARAAADVGDQPDLHLEDRRHRFLCHHAEVGGERKLHRAADAGAVNLGDRRLGHLLEQVPPAQQRLPELAQPARVLRQRVQRADVHARREHRPRPADDDHANRVVVGGVLERVPQRLDELAVQRVPLLRPVHDDVADRAAILDLD